MSASIQMPKLEHATLPSVERIHVFRDPPKSIHTRKIERVELGDVMHHVRGCDDRRSEGIEVYARSNNPYGQWGYPYKVNKQFRPPIVRPREDLLPLSRQPVNYVSIPVRTLSHRFQARVDMEKMVGTLDSGKIKSAVRPSPGAPWSSNQLTRPNGDNLRNIHDEPIQVSAHTCANPENTFSIVDMGKGAEHIKTKDVLFTSVLSRDYDIAVYDSTSRTMDKLTLPDKDHYAIQIAANAPLTIHSHSGVPIKLKDYNWFILNRPGSAPCLVVDNTNRALPELRRNLPSHAQGTNIEGDYQHQEWSHQLPELQHKQPLSSVLTQLSGQYEPSSSNRKIRLRHMLNLGGYEPRVCDPTVTRYTDIPTLKGSGQFTSKVATPDWRSPGHSDAGLEIDRVTPHIKLNQNRHHYSSFTAPDLPTVTTGPV